MIGIELKQPIRDLTLIAARDQGLLINVTRGKTIRLLPPLTIQFFGCTHVTQVPSR